MEISEDRNCLLLWVFNLKRQKEGMFESLGDDINCFKDKPAWNMWHVGCERCGTVNGRPVRASLQME